MNPTLPSKSLKQFYWENEEVQKGLEGNYNNWKAYIKGQKLKKQNNANKEGTTSKQTNSPKNKKGRTLTKRGTNSPKKKNNANKKGATLPKKGATLPKKGTK